MKSQLIEEFTYDGFGFTRKPLDTPIDVEIVGVYTPVDPGLICIKMPDDTLKNVPTFALKNVPCIDFGAMLSDEQKAIRKKMGVLLSNGIGGDRTLIPISECILKKI